MKKIVNVIIWISGTLLLASALSPVFAGSGFKLIAVFGLAVALTSLPQLADKLNKMTGIKLPRNVRAILLLSFILLVPVSFSNPSEYKKQTVVQPSQPTTIQEPTVIPITETKVEQNTVEKQITEAPTNTTVEADPDQAMMKIGADVTTNSNVSVFKNDDGTIDVINNIQVTPEVNVGFDVYTRKWVTEFFQKTYTSDFKIRNVLVTVSFLNTGRSATRVGVGINQAVSVSQSEWLNTTPYDFCQWLQRVSTGEDQDDLANSTFASNFKCN